ncbi:MAG: transketolase [Pseudomonadota bacterium]|nr:transketolase [Pseudomonadota bacterium]
MNNSELKKLKVMANAIRTLSIDAIEKANSGHPGMPMGMADVATVLFSNYLKFNPKKPDWLNRDRFILSAGHGSMLLYAISYLVGYKDCSLNQIKNFRQLGSRTAGHPEFGLLKSIETTTGPLGQGLANSVGMAIAEKILNKKYGNLLDHKTWVIVGDGCLMEGISQEAISLAGHLNLSKLIVLYDDNQISIDGNTNLTCSDDQQKRFEASNWKTLKIDGHNYSEINNAIKIAMKSKKPTLISCKTIIGYGSPNKSGKETCHGSPLGRDESKLTKEFLNWPYKEFYIPDKILKDWRNISKKSEKSYLNWQRNINKSKLKKKFFDQFKIKKFIRTIETSNFLKELKKTSRFEATRKSSQKTLEFLYKRINNLLGGSADLTGSNLTKISLSNSKGKNINYIHYGVREHLMAAAMNGIAVHGGFVPYGGTFLVFSDYCKNAIRLSAMMKKQVIYVFTHDSIGLGEDGPTHQPIEHLEGLRAIPNLNIFRPCDSIETFESWEIALNSFKSPSVLVLSRQNLPLIRNNYNSNKTIKGGYFLNQEKNSRITLISSGSEVSIALEVQELLKKIRIRSNIITMPCIELFDKQSNNYKNSILGKEPRVVIEASSTNRWYKYVNDKDLIFGIDEFGASGKAKHLFDYFGLTAKTIYKKIYKKYFL